MRTIWLSALLVIPIEGFTILASAIASHGHTQDAFPATNDAGEHRAANGRAASEGGPLALTAEQCAGAAQLLKVRTPSIGHFGGNRAAATFAQQHARSTAWAEAGCPEDAVLGFYPSADGKTGYVRILEDESSGMLPAMAVSRGP